MSLPISPKSSLLPAKLSDISYIDRIKLLMMIAMTTGHVAWAFVPTQSDLGVGMHFFARMTIALACFLVVVGYKKTHDLNGYIKRMFGFAVLAQAPFIADQIGWQKVIEEPEQLFYYGNVLFSLGFALVALCCVTTLKTTNWQGRVWRIVVTLLMIGASLWSDWSYSVVVWILAIYYFGWRGYLVTTIGLLLLALVVPEESLLRILNPYKLMDYGGLLSVPIMIWYQRYAPQSPKVYRLPRLMFYWYYALHLAVLGLAVDILAYYFNQ